MTELRWCVNGCKRTTNSGDRIRVQTTPPSLLCDRCEAAAT